MKKRFVCAILTAAISISALSMSFLSEESPLRSDLAEENPPNLDLYEFLDEAELTFEEYISFVKSYADEGAYLHYLEKNAERYRVFQEKYPDYPETTIIAYVNANVDAGFYANIQLVPDPESLYLLVNKGYRFPSGWEPENLVEIRNGHMMREPAAQQYYLLKEALDEQGYSVGFSAIYRSYDRQTGAYNRSADYAGRASADRGVARPGHSEHQAGLAIDFTNYNLALPWLQENAHNYGFILRYPKDFTHIHGYIYEPWHWRFVGIEIATAMHNEGIAVYEEFYGTYLSSDVLYNVKEFIFELRAVAAALAEAQENERLAREEAARLEAEEAAERRASEVAARLEAEEAERLAAEELLAESLARGNANSAQSGQMSLGAALLATLAAMALSSATICISVFAMRKKDAAGQGLPGEQ